MNRERIMIIGSGGSGKTTLANELCVVTGLPVIHLDQLFWRKNWTHISKEQFDILLSDEINKEQWIIDGNFNRTIPMRLARCDTVIYLDFPRRVCIWGVIKRVLYNYGKTRADMGEDCPERFDLEFLKWVWNFNKNNRSKYYQMLKTAHECKVYILHSRNDCKELLNNWYKESDTMDD